MRLRQEDGEFKEKPVSKSSYILSLPPPPMPSFIYISMNTLTDHLTHLRWEYQWEAALKTGGSSSVGQHGEIQSYYILFSEPFSRLKR